MFNFHEKCCILWKYVLTNVLSSLRSLDLAPTSIRSVCGCHCQKLLECRLIVFMLMVSVATFVLDMCISDMDEFVFCLVLGEHGDSQIVPRSIIKIGNHYSHELYININWCSMVICVICRGVQY